MSLGDAVLVIPHPVPTDPNALLQRSDYFFLERAAAERDNSVKQIIPYVLVVHRSKVLAYRRSSILGEARLSNLLSVGWGGHIEMSDANGDQNDTPLQSFISNCASREIREELSLGFAQYKWQLGLLYDESNEVDQCHLGWLEIWFYDDIDSIVVDDAAEDVFWMPISHGPYAVEKFETWSRLALERLAGFLEI